MKQIFFGAALAMALAFTSCNTPHNIAYFQDISEGQSIVPQSSFDIRVKPDDKLAILVTTQDPQLSSLFNLVHTQSRLTGNSSYAGYDDSRVAYYTVNPEGDITFPVLGKLHLSGMRRSEVAEFIQNKLIEDDLVKQPVVTVEFMNTGISVIGEVAHPGRYEFNRDRLTILDAISLAGDLKNTGMRENVMVIRSNGEQKDTYLLDLTDAKSLAASPAYYLQQEDIVYVEPNLKSKRETTSAGNTPYSPSFWISVGSIGISLATLIVTLAR